MRIELDANQMRAHMALWCDAVAMRPGLAGIPAAVDRAKLLVGAVAMTSGWLDLLQMCSCEAGELDSLTSDIRAFQDWARAGTTALSLLEAAERM